MTKKIAFLIYDINDFAGGEKVSIETANRLCDFYDVYLISAFPLKHTTYHLDSRIHFLTLNLKNKRVILNYIQGIFPLSKILKKYKFSSIFLVGTNVSLFSILKVFNQKIKFVYSDHASLKGTLSDRKGTFIRNYSHKFSDLTVVLTKKNIDHYVRYLNANPKKMTFIYNPIAFREKKNPYNVQSNRIITVGRLSEEKGFDLLVQVAIELSKVNKNWKWDIYGDGPLFNDIKKLIIDNGLESYVFLKGTTNRIMEIYNDYSIYVLTSYREGLPLVLLEAKYCGLPIVSFNIDTGPDEIVRDGENGYLISAYDVKTMADKINELLVNGNKRKTFSDNADIDLEKFDGTKILEQWKNIIEN